MEFDIIDVTDEEIEALPVVQRKMIRTAQKAKDELEHKKAQTMTEYKKLLFASGTHRSSLLVDKQTQLNQEFEYQVGILREQLLFNMSLNEPTTDGDTGNEGGDASAGYLVDRELSYLERYIVVRDYYLAIEDPDERLALYAADEVAKEYLGSYYNTLFDYLVRLSEEG